jgi:hypothetical protein
MSARRGSSSAASRSESSSPFASSSSAREGASESNSSSTFAFGTAPTNSPATSPSRKALTAGMPCTPKRAARPWLASTSTFASTTLPSRACSAASSAGPSVRHGPHHSAQKSTTTGTSFERSTTSRSKLASVTSIGMAGD